MRTINSNQVVLPVLPEKTRAQMHNDYTAKAMSMSTEDFETAQPGDHRFYKDKIFCFNNKNHPECQLQDLLRTVNVKDGEWDRPLYEKLANIRKEAETFKPTKDQLFWRGNVNDVKKILLQRIDEYVGYQKEYGKHGLNLFYSRTKRIATELYSSEKPITEIISVGCKRLSTISGWELLTPNQKMMVVGVLVGTLAGLTATHRKRGKNFVQTIKKKLRKRIPTKHNHTHSHPSLT